MENQTFSDFTRRTDILAAQLKVRLGDLPARLEVSRASFFAYRSGKSPITNKAWHKLLRAERESGISPPLAQQISSAKAEQKGELIASASLEEILGLLPVAERARLAASYIDGHIESIEWQMNGFFLNAQSLARLVAEKKPPRSELMFFSRTVDQSLEPCRKAWQSLVRQFRETLGLDARSLADRVKADVPAVSPTKPSGSKKRRKKKR